MEIKKETKISAFVATVVALLLSLGVNIPNLTENDSTWDNIFVCPATGEAKYFEGGISKTTGLTGYPFKDSRKSPTYCYLDDSKIPWMNAKLYASENGIDLLDLIKPKEKPVEKIDSGIYGLKYICNNKGCRKI